jgi:hypothetical protein
MNRLVLCVLLIAFAGPASADDQPAPLPIAVRTANANYEAAKKKAQEEYQNKLKLANRNYLLAIDASIKEAMRTGNLQQANRLNALKKAAQDDAAAEKAPSDTPPRAFLADLEYFDLKITGDWWGKKGLLRGFKVAINGKNYPNAIAMCPVRESHGSISFRLGGKYQLLQTGMAMDDSCAGLNKTAVTFEVLGDGKSLWKSPPVKEMKKIGECKVDIIGVDVLELRVNCPGDHDHVHAVWLEPEVLK